MKKNIIQQHILPSHIIKFMKKISGYDKYIITLLLARNLMFYHNFLVFSVILVNSAPNHVYKNVTHAQFY